MAGGIAGSVEIIRKALSAFSCSSTDRRITQKRLTAFPNPNVRFPPIADISRSGQNGTMISVGRISQFIPAGTPVRFDGPETGPEYGVVVSCWHDDEIQDWDCYVAFFGDAMPLGKPTNVYVLRYASVCLDVVR